VSYFADQDFYIFLFYKSPCFYFPGLMDHPADDRRNFIARFAKCLRRRRGVVGAYRRVCFWFYCSKVYKQAIRFGFILVKTPEVLRGLAAPAGHFLFPADLAD